MARVPSARAFTIPVLAALVLGSFGIRPAHGQGNAPDYRPPQACDHAREHLPEGHCPPEFTEVSGQLWLTVGNVTSSPTNVIVASTGEASASVSGDGTIAFAVTPCAAGDFSCYNYAAFGMRISTPIPAGTAITYDLLDLEGQALLEDFDQANCRLDDASGATDSPTVYELSTAALGETTVSTGLDHPAGGTVWCEFRSAEWF